jgi:rubrerythrin
MDRPYMKDVFLGFAKEEMGHKSKLMGVKSGKKLHASEKEVQDLKLAETLVEVDLSATNMDYQDALIAAMKAEKAAYRLYTDLASATDNADLQGLFKSLAQEEAKHKLRFEIEYDDHVLKEN